MYNVQMKCTERKGSRPLESLKKWGTDSVQLNIIMPNYPTLSRLFMSAEEREWGKNG